MKEEERIAEMAELEYLDTMGDLSHPDIFAKLVETMILEECSKDPILALKIAQIDKQAYKENRSVYELIFDLYCKREIEDKAKDWVSKL